MVEQKITIKEWMDFIDKRMYQEGFTRNEREAVKAAFSSSLKDVDKEDKRPLFGNPVPGINVKEGAETMKDLRDRNSDLSRGLDVRLYEQPHKLDVLEKILNEALKGDKQSGWF